MDSEDHEVPAASCKRKNTADRVADDGRIIKHRASQACQSCRTRKVRCDVLKSPLRCTNCRLHQLECVVLASRRGRKKRGRSGQDQNHRGESGREQTHRGRGQKQRGGHLPSTTASGALCDFSPAETNIEAWSAPDDNTGSVPTCVTFDDDQSSPNNDDDGANVADHRSSIVYDTNNNLSPSMPYFGLLTPGTRPESGFQSQRGAPEQTPLPAFINPLPSNIVSEDLEYLIRKGALKIPEPDLQIEILRAYMFSVHPFMPLLDYRAFAHAVLSNRQDNRISLLLFQAVMFAGLTSLPPEVLRRLGFGSAKQARGVFFNRARLLYELDVEHDVATTLQSLILMSSWYSQWDARRDTWYWTGQAYDVARRMGLHREPTARFASGKVRHFRRRLWWSLYIRDRMIALGTRRPMRIYDSDCDVAMLTLDDFDLEPFDELYQGQRLIPEGEENEDTARMCIQLAKLCIHVGHVVSSQYTTQDRDIPSTVMVVSRRGQGRAAELERCDRELSAWFEESSNENRPTGSQNIGSNSCSSVHWAVLNMTYQTTVNVLHRNQALQANPNTADTPAQQVSSKSKVKRSACSLTKLLHSMLRRDELRFLGLIGVTAIIAAYLSHLLDITSAHDEDEDACDAGTFRLYQSLEVLQAFRNIYASADAAVSFLASVSQKAGVAVPMQVLAEPTSSGRQARRVADGPGLHTAPGDSHPTNTFSTARPLVSSRNQQQALSVDRDAQSLAFNSSTARLNMPAMILSADQQSNPQSVDTTMGTLSSSTGDLASLFNWDNTVDGVLGNGVDLGPMTFNHDFYIDAFGFTDAQFSGM